MVPIFTLRKLSVCTIKIYLFVRLFSIKYVCSFYSAFTLKLFNRASKGYKRRPFLLKSGEMNQIWKGEKLLGVGPVAKIDECMSRIWLLCKKFCSPIRWYNFQSECKCTLNRNLKGKQTITAEKILWKDFSFLWESHYDSQRK